MLFFKIYSLPTIKYAIFFSNFTFKTDFQKVIFIKTSSKGMQNFNEFRINIFIDTDKP